MKSRKLVLSATLMGMPIKLATIKVGSPANEAELKQWTDLVCPEDKRSTHYVPPVYECECGFKATAWQKLTRVIKGTTKILKIPKLTQDDTVQQAQMYRISTPNFIALKIADCVDSKDAEHPVLCDDDESKSNLFKIMSAQESGQSVIILRWNDTTEQIIAMLTLTPSGRIVLRKLIPKNLVRGLERGLWFDKTKLTEDDIDQAKVFLKQLPEATAKTFEVNDYRIQQFDVMGQQTFENDQVVALERVQAMLEKVGVINKNGKTKVEKVVKASAKTVNKKKKKVVVQVPARLKRKK